MAASSAHPPPDENPKTIFGILKAPLRLIPAVGIARIAGAFAQGALKYGPMNWRKQRVSTSTYYDAALRHLVAWWDGENLDPESGEHHLGHAAACLCIIMDGETLAGDLRINDDRPPKGATSRILAEMAEKTKASTTRHEGKSEIPEKDVDEPKSVP